MTNQPTSTQAAAPALMASELALQFYQAILTRDYTTLRDVFHWTKSELDSMTPDQQFTAAGKLISAGNIAIRKVPMTKSAIEASKPPATVTPAQRPTFTPYAGSTSKFAPPAAA
ncbi:hypothetical protein [Citrobacter portucalensis]|uniref:hypothetical protein n=1 Tax=Citrobacter portucalensis TaxID=1639133 RepID=UPI0022433480|nr:hypothetical protein [Citrobacter portucalensis]MCW8351459.1 hypothetical protein [Citrobacter portucalensis]MCX9050843.1 hypothetical protein [Citrobacter portucalensis]MCX9056855.1 hypothetical protein [Citrobacter portucalensis]